MEKILVIGAAGQIGSELTLALRKVYGDLNVFATDIKDAPKDVKKSGPFQLLDVMDDKRLIHFVIRYKITQIYLLAAVLSGNAERLPLQAWDINMRRKVQTLLAKFNRSIRSVYSKSKYSSVYNYRTKHSLRYQQTCRRKMV